MDVELAAFDVLGSLAHARGLRAAGLVSKAQLRAIERGLAKIADELDSSRFAFKETDEDIHTAVERRLTELDPDAGARLHTGRSRNDQVALDLRLYCRAQCASLAGAVAELIESLADQALRHATQPMPGYTHLQRAQPVTVGHHLLAHAEPLLRDAERVRHAYAAADRMPLGSGALAGSTLPMAREAVAKELGFSALTENSIDAVSDRDFALDLVYACASVAIHLSRLGEDVVLWASSEFGFVRLADRIATGSSLMPQKKNPDIAELIRGRSGRAIGSLTALATVLKGPLFGLSEEELFRLAHNRGGATLWSRLRRFAPEYPAMEAAAERLHELLARADFVPPTDSAEKLVAEGVSFREAHRRVARLVREGSHQAPWGPERSLELRRLDAAARARAVRRQVVGLRRWAETHPPPMAI